MLVKIEARILIFPGTDFHFPSTSVPPGTFLRLCLAITVNYTFQHATASPPLCRHTASQHSHSDSKLNKGQYNVYNVLQSFITVHSVDAQHLQTGMIRCTR